MAGRATSTFVIDSWEPTPYDEQDGATLTRTRVTKTFQGDIVGTSTAELLMAQAQEGSAAYVGFERIVGTLDGRSGSFVLHHNATMTRETQAATWTVLLESGPGDLRGLRGQAQITVLPDGGHTLTLEYDLP
ncbi:MAG TPA: DUF3224 domain-containing protein [Chloroflexota bacterium]|nr:DUF3224 domain-containing protein [Chloroflexota bacterium]